MNLPTFNNAQYYIEKSVDFGIEYGLKIIGALAIIIIGRWIVKMVLNIIKTMMGRAKIDDTLISFAGNLLYVVLMIIVIIAAASNIGINTTSFVAVFASAGLAIGLALKDTLANVGAAVLIIFFRPFKAGDFIETSGVMGKVKAITLFSTTLTTADNRSIIIPNGTLITGNIINYTGNDERRIDMAFEIDYKDDLKLAKEVINSLLANHPKILKEPAAVVAVGSLGRDGVELIVRPWVKVDDYWDVKFEVTEALKTAFDANGISIPYPQMDLHVKRGIPIK